MHIAHCTMRHVHTSPEPLLPLFRSRTQLDVLTAAFLDAKGHTIAELTEVTGADRSTVLREVNRLVDAGVLVKESVGRTGVISVASDLPWAEDLRGLLTKTSGPAALLSRLFAADPTVVEAHIFGSWAARYHGEPGPWPRDIDVLVVGDHLSPLAIRADLADLEPSIGVEINPQFASVGEWRHARGRSFLGQVKHGPLVSVKDAGGSQGPVHDRPGGSPA